MIKRDYGLEEYGIEDYGLEEYGKDAHSTEEYGIDERIDGYLVTDIELCIDQNTEYYINRFRNLPTREINGAAMVFAMNWMAYRHMWREGIMLYFLQIASVFIAVPFLVKGTLNGSTLTEDIALPVMLVSLIVYCLLTGFFGDTIYWKKIKRELDRFNRKDSTIPMTEEEKGELQDRTKISFIYSVCAIILYKLLDKVILYLITYLFIVRLS